MWFLILSSMHGCLLDTHNTIDHLTRTAPDWELFLCLNLGAD